MPLRYKIDVLAALKEKGYNTTKIRTEGLLSQSTLQKFRNQQGQRGKLDQGRLASVRELRSC